MSGSLHTDRKSQPWGGTKFPDTCTEVCPHVSVVSLRENDFMTQQLRWLNHIEFLTNNDN